MIHKDKDKDKEALFNVAYNVTDNISHELFCDITISLTDTDLPYSIFLAQTLFMRSSARVLLEPFFHLWYGGAAEIEPTTSRSESRRSTNWAIKAYLYSMQGQCWDPSAFPCRVQQIKQYKAGVHTGNEKHSIDK